jgi:hypothetical protein
VLGTRYCFVVYEKNLWKPEEQYKSYSHNRVVIKQCGLLEQMCDSSFFSIGSVLLTNNEFFWDVTLRLWMSSTHISKKNRSFFHFKVYTVCLALKVRHYGYSKRHELITVLHSFTSKMTGFFSSMEVHS